MTKAFEEDTAALRNIVIAERKGAEAAADAAIAAERRAIKEPAASFDLKPCYRVKALGAIG